MNDFLDNGFCEDELNHGDCMFDGLDCCGYDDNNDGDYDDSLDFAPGDTALCTECLCKGMSKFEKSIAMLQKNLPCIKRFEIHCDRLYKNEIILTKLHYS